MPDLPSVFDPDAQHDDPDAKIVAALERLSQAFRVLLWDEAQPRGLSPVQIRILVHLKHHGPSLRRVGRLAEEFDLAPPTVSDAVSTLEKKGLVRKTTSPRDRRVSILELTDDGERRAEELSGWAEAVREAVARFPEEEKVARLTEQNVLLQLQHLRTHPAVAAAIARGAMELHGWIYDIESGEISAYREDVGAFVPLADAHADAGLSEDRRAEAR